MLSPKSLFAMQESTNVEISNLMPTRGLHHARGEQRTLASTCRARARQSPTYGDNAYRRAHRFELRCCHQISSNGVAVCRSNSVRFGVYPDVLPESNKVYVLRR